MVTNARPPNETILAIAVPPLAAASLCPPTRPSMDGAAELLTLDRRLPAEAKSVTRHNLTGNKRVAGFPFLLWGRGIMVWHTNHATMLASALHLHGRPTQPANQGKNPGNQGSSRLIKPQSRQKPL